MYKLFKRFKLFLTTCKFRRLLLDTNDIKATSDKLDKELSTTIFFKDEWLKVKRDYDEYLISYL